MRDKSPEGDQERAQGSPFSQGDSIDFNHSDDFFSEGIEMRRERQTQAQRHDVQAST